MNDFLQMAKDDGVAGGVVDAVGEQEIEIQTYSVTNTDQPCRTIKNYESSRDVSRLIFIIKSSASIIKFNFEFKLKQFLAKFKNY